MIIVYNLIDSIIRINIHIDIAILRYIRFLKFEYCELNRYDYRLHITAAGWDLLAMLCKHLLGDNADRPQRVPQLAHTAKRKP